MNSINRFDKNYFKRQYGEQCDEAREYLKYFTNIVCKSCLPSKVLDAGCGFGFSLSEFQEIGIEAHGIDVSEFVVKSNENPNVILGNVQNLPYRDESFDVVISTEVLEHLENPKQAIEELKRVLRDDGYILLTTPKPESEYAKGDPTHISIYPEDSWIKCFSELTRYKYLEENIRNTQAKYYSKTKPKTFMGKILSEFKYLRERMIKYYNDRNSTVLVFKKGEKPKSLFIHTPAFHQAHRVFAQTINADSLEVYSGEFGGGLKKLLLALKYSRRYPEYKYYILEGGIPLFPMMIRNLIKGNNSKVIGLLADETIINFAERLPHYSTMEVFIHKLSSKYLDGAIAVSPMINEYAQKYLKIPIKVVRPCIEEKTFEKLAKINPNLEENSVVNVGYSKPSVGMDILVKAFENLEKGSLYVVGEGHPKTYEKIKGVKVLGWVNNLAEVFKKVSLFVHPARGGAYPVTTLEAMRGGIPTIVSTMTGTKDVVYEVENEFKEMFGFYHGSKFVISPDSIEVAKSIKWYFSLPIVAKEFLSARFREKSKRYHPRIVSKEFKEAFENLKEEIK